PFNPKGLPSRMLDEHTRYAVYVLKHGGDPVAIDIGDAEKIDRTVSEFRSTAADPERSDAKAAARALYEEIVSPISKYVSDTSHLLVSPDGALNLVPMAALPDENGQYLAQKFEISYLTSGRDLLPRDSVSNPLTNTILIADPDFSGNGKTS